MNCGAKLPVYALLVAAFFPKKQAMIMVILTLISWIGALLVAKLLRSTVIRGEATPFVMELPPYRFPTLKGLLIHTWERTWQYMKKAGTVILGISILIWAMMTFPGLDDKTTAQFESQRTAITDSVPADVLKEIESADKYTELSSEAREVKDALAGIDGRQALSRLENSLAGRIGKTLEKVSYLAGFDWRTNIALVGGFAAKEVVVSTLGTAYSLGDVDSESSMSLANRLAQAPGWGPVTAFALMIFTIFYAPCFVTVVCISRETGSWKWAAFSVVFNTTLAFALSVLTYQVGSLLVN
jgi:ferrous iron transport protein B